MMFSKNVSDPMARARGSMGLGIVMVLLGLGVGPCPPAVAAPFSTSPAPMCASACTSVCRENAGAAPRQAALHANFTMSSFWGNRDRMIQVTLVAVMVGIYILVWRK